MNLSERLQAAERDAQAPKAAAVPVETTPSVTPGAKPQRLRTSHTESALESLKLKVRAAVVRELGPALASGEVDETHLKARLEHHLSDNVRQFNVSVSPSERSGFFAEVLADMMGWGPLEALLDDPTITEVMCNGHADVWVERKGVIERDPIHFSTPAAYRQVIDRMLAVAGRRVDDSSPMADGRLHDGSRINVIIPPLVVGEPVLTIRRFPEIALTMADLIAMKAVSGAAATFLEAAIEGKLNVIISGGTGTGKTTMLNVLSNYIPPNERVITIEDAAELRLEQPHRVTLEARPPNIEGVGQVTIRDLVRNALRMRPDRMVFGEVGGGESLDMVHAMNTGLVGSLSTVHANSARDALARVETMVLFAGMDLPLKAIREQIASAIDLVVHLGRRSDGSRVIDRICEVQGREGEIITMQDVFARTGGGELEPSGLRPKCAEKMADRGKPVAPALFRPAPAPEGAKRKRTR